MAEAVGQTGILCHCVCLGGVTDDSVDIKDFSAAASEVGGETAPVYLRWPRHHSATKFGDQQLFSEMTLGTFPSMAPYQESCWHSLYFNCGQGKLDPQKTSLFHHFLAPRKLHFNVLLPNQLR